LAGVSFRAGFSLVKRFAASKPSKKVKTNGASFFQKFLQHMFDFPAQKLNHRLTH
jgi:hypothetical protein